MDGPRCLSCARPAVDFSGLCRSCGGLTLVPGTGEYSVALPEVAAAAFRDQAADIVHDYLPGADAEAMKAALKKGSVLVVTDLDKDIADGFGAVFDQIPLKAMVQQGAPKLGAGALLRAGPWALGAVAAAGAYVAFPGLAVLDLFGGGALGLSAAALLALRNKPAMASPSIDGEVEALFLEDETLKAARRLQKELPDDARLPFARAIAASTAAPMRLLTADGMVSAAVDAAWLDESLDALRDSAIAVGKRLAAGQSPAPHIEKLNELADLAETLDREIENAEKSLAGVSVRKQIEDQLDVVRATAAALTDA